MIGLRPTDRQCYCLGKMVTESVEREPDFAHLSYSGSPQVTHPRPKQL